MDYAQEIMLANRMVENEKTMSSLEEVIYNNGEISRKNDF